MSISINNYVNSNRTLLTLTDEALLAAVQAGAWRSLPGPNAWVTNMSLISRLGATGGLPLIGTINALADGLAPLPVTAPAGSQLLITEARNALRAAPGVNIADPETLPMLLLLREAIPDLAVAITLVIGFGWLYDTALAGATLADITTAREHINVISLADERIEWARQWYEQVRQLANESMTANTVLNKSNLKDLLVVI